MTMQHHDHDDGLVHDHGWACRERGRMTDAVVNRPAQPDHDDGLVHGHGWACGERGRPAGR
jgi:hypothetical protein